MVRPSIRSRLAAPALAAALAAALPLQAQGQAAQGRFIQPNPPRQHIEAVEAYGGFYEDPQLTRYVAQVGERVAAAAGRPRQCGFHVVNSDVVNAFTAPPGCHVYVTRGLLAIINSEDELASVLGHEVGHVAANHAGRRQQRSVLTGLGALIVGAVTGSGELAQLAGQFGQLNVLSYSRSQEYEADNLGIRYLAQTGYSPVALSDMLSALQAEDQLSDRLRGREAEKAVPEWARSHPLTGERIRRAADQARRVGPPAPEREDPFLAAIDGMTYGDDPEQGFVEGRAFVHPRMGIAFEAPPGFALTNSPRAVKIEGPGGITGEFAAGRAAGRLEDYAVQVLRRVAGNTPVQMGQPQRTRINGVDAVVLPAYARTRSGAVEVTVAAYDPGGETAYHFVTLAPAGRARAVEPLIGSFQRIGPAEARNVRARRLEVVQVRPGETVLSLSQRMAFDDFREERFRLLNGLGPGEPVRPGERVKLVTYARR